MSSLVFAGSNFIGRRSEPLYEDPFDIGAGGTTLTWATQEGILINNPALLPYGEKLIRWLGFKGNIISGFSKDSQETLKNLGQGETSTEESQSEQGQIDEFISLLPLHLGLSTTGSFITNNGGAAVFAANELDVNFWEKGDPELGVGTPNIIIRNEAYGGAYASLATRTFWRWLSLGLSFKYVLLQANSETIDPTNLEQIQGLQEKFSEFSANGIGQGMGADGAFLMFFQGSHVDFRIAGSVVNVGKLKLTGGSRSSLPQMLNLGLGLSFHSTVDVIHFSLDIRDVTDESADIPDNGNIYSKNYRKIHLGVRAMLRTYLGLAAGLYHGNPTYGLELDLIFMRLAAAFYTREYVLTPGIEKRPILTLSITSGLTF